MELRAVVGVSNNSSTSIVVYVEPWADSFVLAAGERQTITAIGAAKLPWFNVVYSDGAVQVYVEDAETFSTTAVLA